MGDLGRVGRPGRHRRAARRCGHAGAGVPCAAGPHRLASRAREGAGDPLRRRAVRITRRRSRGPARAGPSRRLVAGHPDRRRGPGRMGRVPRHRAPGPRPSRPGGDAAPPGARDGPGRRRAGREWSFRPDRGRFGPCRGRALSLRSRASPRACSPRGRTCRDIAARDRCLARVVAAGPQFRPGPGEPPAGGAGALRVALAGGSGPVRARAQARRVAQRHPGRDRRGRAAGTHARGARAGSSRGTRAHRAHGRPPRRARRRPAVPARSPRGGRLEPGLRARGALPADPRPGPS